MRADTVLCGCEFEPTDDVKMQVVPGKQLSWKNVFSFYYSS